MLATGRNWARVVVAFGLLSGLALTGAPPAVAHNGVGAAFKGPAGRYTVYAYDGYRLPNGQLEYRLVLLDTATGEPAADVAPVITAFREPAASAPAELNFLRLHLLDRCRTQAGHIRPMPVRRHPMGGPPRLGVAAGRD